MKLGRNNYFFVLVVNCKRQVKGSLGPVVQINSLLPFAVNAILSLSLIFSLHTCLVFKLLPDYCA